MQRRQSSAGTKPYVFMVGTDEEDAGVAEAIKVAFKGEALRNFDQANCFAGIGRQDASFVFAGPSASIQDFGGYTPDSFVKHFIAEFERTNKDKHKSKVLDIYLIGDNVGVTQKQDESTIGFFLGAFRDTVDSGWRAPFAQQVADKLYAAGFTGVSVHALANGDVEVSENETMHLDVTTRVGGAIAFAAKAKSLNQTSTKTPQVGDITAYILNAVDKAHLDDLSSTKSSDAKEIAKIKAQKVVAVGVNPATELQKTKHIFTPSQLLQEQKTKEESEATEESEAEKSTGLAVTFKTRAKELKETLSGTPRDDSEISSEDKAIFALYNRAVKLRDDLDADLKRMDKKRGFFYTLFHAPKINVETRKKLALDDLIDLIEQKNLEEVPGLVNKLRKDYYVMYRGPGKEGRTAKLLNDIHAVIKQRMAGSEEPEPITPKKK